MKTIFYKPFLSIFLILICVYLPSVKAQSPIDLELDSLISWLDQHIYDSGDSIYQYAHLALNKAKKEGEISKIAHAHHLKEIHHRVKNNLQVVSGLLELQSAQIDDPNIQDAILASQNRVHSMGIIHQKLYHGENLAAIEMQDYFLNLSDNILDAFGVGERIQIECIMDKLELDVDTAVPIGLIVNELLTNALKYAFPDGRKGKIKIQLSEIDTEGLHLTIKDNGIGKDLHSEAQRTGFGTQLVKLLTLQLQGKMHEKIEKGTIISFDLKRIKAA